MPPKDDPKKKVDTTKQRKGSEGKKGSRPNSGEPELLSGKGKFIFKDGTLYDGEYKQVAITAALVNDTQSHPEPTHPPHHEPHSNTNKKGEKETEENETTGHPETVIIMVRHGYGKNTCGKTGCLYEGEWDMDKMDGKGRLEYPNGVVYEGYFHANQFQGSGEYVFQDKSKFTGSWDNGVPHGPGTFIDKKSHKWMGQFFQGAATGLVAEIQT